MAEELVTLRDGARLWTTSSGTGLPLLLLNGGPGMADYLAPVAELLHGAYRVHRYEQRGCGRSSGADRLTLIDFIKDLEELRAHWQIDQWTLIGHSWGVDLGLAYALHHPQRVSGLIGLSGGRVHNDRVWKQVYDESRHKETQPVAAAPVNAAVNKALNADWRALCRAPDMLRLLANLALPVCFIYGENDIRPSWPTEQLSQLIPNARFELIQGADHNLWQHEAAELRHLLLDYLRAQSES